jgi:hypothetical protein
MSVQKEKERQVSSTGLLGQVFLKGTAPSKSVNIRFKIFSPWPSRPHCRQRKLELVAQSSICLQTLYYYWVPPADKTNLRA